MENRSGLSPLVYRQGLRYPAAMLTLGAAAIHFSVAPDHLLVYLPFGVLFIVTGAAQAALALLTVLAPGRRVFVAAALVAAGCLAVWVVSRTVGLPVGPTPGKHSHQDTENQVPLGLYGALVVEPSPSPGYDRDYAVIVGDSNATAASDGLHLDASPGEMVRLRAISAIAEDMNGTPEFLALIGAPYRVISLDGHDLNQPQELGPELLPVGTGQRYDLLFRMPATGQVALRDLRPQTGGRALARLWATLGDGAAPPAPAGSLPRFDRTAPRQYSGSSLPTFDLTTYGEPAADPVASRTTYDVSRDLRISNQLGFRYGSQLPKAWEFIHMFNGKSFPDTPPIIVREGQYVRLRFINSTDEYHPIHLHGHYFSVLSKNGRPISGSPVHLDSVLVGPHETWEVAFLADNPGLWMLHCHVLIHAAYGLSTMISYQGISTPYTIGSRDGNFPE
jgi:FtsP/CotA-like multicopper oxidase with cupredoxin domain